MSARCETEGCALPIGTAYQTGAEGDYMLCSECATLRMWGLADRALSVIDFIGGYEYLTDAGRVVVQGIDTERIAPDGSAREGDA